MNIKWRSSIVGVLIIAVGVLWVLQGTDSLGQSGGMNGQENWTLIGSAAVVAGIALLAYVNRKRK